jgi:hypothetical protein
LWASSAWCDLCSGSVVSCRVYCVFFSFFFSEKCHANWVSPRPCSVFNHLKIDLPQIGPDSHKRWEECSWQPWRGLISLPATRVWRYYSWQVCISVFTTLFVGRCSLFSSRSPKVRPSCNLARKKLRALCKAREGATTQHGERNPRKIFTHLLPVLASRSLKLFLGFRRLNTRLASCAAHALCATHALVGWLSAWGRKLICCATRGWYKHHLVLVWCSCVTTLCPEPLC